MRHPLVPALLAAAACAAAAQESQTVLITGNPWRDERPQAAASVLQGTPLLLRRGGALGDTLDGLPGVAATRFGPHASRPVIRGQDGDRIRILANGGATLDASSLSFDHAVPLDPLVVERLEVLRGPAALLYGGSAVGGVVNAIDNRIPAAPLDGVSGAAELRAGGAANERGTAALVEAGGGGLSWHADAFLRRADDLRVPPFDRPTDSGSERSTRVTNSAGRAEGGAVGGAWHGRDAMLGLSVDSHRQRYGTVAEEDVTIRMQRDRLAAQGEWRWAEGPFARLRGQWAWTDYRHTEFEGSEVGTVFTQRGHDGRIELTQRAQPLADGQWDGVLGLQADAAAFGADGAEAFVPGTRTAQTGLFVLQRWQRGGTQLSAGLRREWVRVQSDGDPAEVSEPRFGEAQSRRFGPTMASLGVAQSLGSAWRLSASLAHTERAPTAYELYADGVHVATAAYERGNPAQRTERGRHAELTLAWQQDAHRLQATVFASRFSRYIALLPTGGTVVDDEDGSVLPVYTFEAVPAALRGWELEGRWRALDGTWRLDFEALADGVRADNRRDGTSLPRIAPRRLTLGADLQHGPWGLRLQWRHAARQDRVPADDLATDGWSMLDLALTREQRLEAVTLLWFLRGSNLGDTLAFNAATTPTLRPLSPLPGRSVSGGVQLRW